MSEELIKTMALLGYISDKFNVDMFHIKETVAEEEDCFWEWQESLADEKYEEKISKYKKAIEAAIESIVI